mmetsp:Transcript_25517/g.80164  ORF Transcript_25517/g.80164 Transcript_25517/m.80164 type:complete len:325 (-) Transcript_25517:405-1379(-)
MAPQRDRGYAGFAHLLPASEALKAIVCAVLPAGLVAHLVCQHGAAVRGAGAVHVLQHHAAAGRLPSVGRTRGAGLRRLVRQHHDLLLAASVVIDRQDGVRPLAEAEAHEAVVGVEVLQAARRVLVAAVAVVRSAGAADDIVHAGVLHHVLAVIVAGDVDGNTESAQQGVQLIQDLARDAVAARRVHGMMADGYLPVCGGARELRGEPRELLLPRATPQDGPGLAGPPDDGGVDVEEVDGQPRGRRVARLVPEARHAPPPAPILGVVGEVPLGPSIAVPVVVAGDDIPGPLERGVPHVHLPPPPHNDPWVPLRPVGVYVVPDAVD